MVKLIVNDYDQITTLEYWLTQKNIPFELELSEKSYGFRSPYLIVDGVPLDFNRSLKWLKGQGEHE